MGVGSGGISVLLDQSALVTTQAGVQSRTRAGFESQASVVPQGKGLLRFWEPLRGRHHRLLLRFILYLPALTEASLWQQGGSQQVHKQGEAHLSSGGGVFGVCRSWSVCC